MKNILKFGIVVFLTTAFTTSYAQQVEVQGELKVTQLNLDESGETLVIKNTDGTLGTRTVASLPLPPPPIDTSRNLASDFELAKHLCDCPNLPPFMIQKLLDSGYTAEDLIASGILVQDVIDAQRNGILIDSRDHKSYKTVTIGTQKWMAENLNFGTRIDGTVNQTSNNIIEKYCYDDNTANCTTYGGLYQWDEMMQYTTTAGTQGVCPDGWHLPTDTEWKTLEMQLGMSSSEANGAGYRGTDQGSQLGDNETFWTDGTLDQNGVFGSSGFAALPSGYRDASGSVYYQSSDAGLWSSSESGSYAWYRHLYYDTPKVYRLTRNESIGLSVRCVQD